VRPQAHLQAQVEASVAPASPRFIEKSHITSTSSARSFTSRGSWGWHWCGYIENLNRGWGMKDPWDEPYTDYVDPVADFNRTVYDLI
jgi:hypothetical protein